MVIIAEVFHTVLDVTFVLLTLDFANDHGSFICFPSIEFCV